jgi:hypothetical protein
VTSGRAEEEAMSTNMRANETAPADRRARSPMGVESGAAGDNRRPRTHHRAIVAAEAVAGMVAGGLVGSLAGPAGIAVGAVLGGAAAAAAGSTALGNAKELRAHDAKLDADIGVDGGNLGAAPPNQPPVRIGAFSRASMGVGPSSGPSGEGPIQNVE